jgi:hypothetical protein
MMGFNRAQLHNGLHDIAQPHATDDLDKVHLCRQAKMHFSLLGICITTHQLNRQTPCL